MLTRELLQDIQYSSFVSIIEKKDKFVLELNIGYVQTFIDLSYSLARKEVTEIIKANRVNLLKENNRRKY